jgi:thymidine kinase
MIGDMYPAGEGGWIEVVCGVMFSGKSEELIRRVRRALIARKKVQVFKTHLDERYAGLYHVSSHDGRTVEAVPVDSPEQIAREVRPETQVVAIDEAQFLPPGIVDLATALAASGRRVILAGTDTDFRGEPQPAADRRQAGALRLADDHGGGKRELRGTVPELPRGAEEG